MRKMKMFLTIIMVAVFAIPMVACESNGEPTPVAEPVSVAEPTEEPTVEAEPTEEPTVEAEPTEEPTVEVEENPNVIDGYDFTDYNEENRSENYDKVVDSMDYDSVRFIIHRVQDYQHKVVGILSDGDNYNMAIGEEMIDYLYFYFPKEPAKVEVDGMCGYETDTPTYLYIQEEKGNKGYSANVRDRSILTDGYELTGHVVYTDGTEETIKVTLYPAE